MARPAPRLFLDDVPPLTLGLSITLKGGQWHYISKVLRLGANGHVRVFDGANGEWLGLIVEAGTRQGTIAIDQRLRQQTAAAGPLLLFSPIRKDPLSFLVQKATELGVRALWPVTMARTQGPQQARASEGRLQTIAAEASEQSERLDVPTITPPRSLADALAAVSGGPIVFCDEANTTGEGAAQPIVPALQALQCGADDIAILIGPEGGFTPEEREQIVDTAGVVPISLGPRILRAETAAIAALSAVQFVCAPAEKV